MNYISLFFALVTFVLVLIWIISEDKRIDEIERRTNVIIDSTIDLADNVDHNFDVHTKWIDDLSGPYYGEMIEDDNE